MRNVAVGAWIALAGLLGCQAGGSGDARGEGERTEPVGEVTAKASAVTVTYYYLPG